ncbi:MAG: GyrI-like domain-containing protein [Bacillota bacterium]
MQPRIEIIPEKKLVGKHMRMSLAQNRTSELWRSFMTEIKGIKNLVSSDLISMQVYDASLDFKDFNLTTEFEKWAAVEVADFNSVPDNMDTCILQGGLYAVFIYKGLPSQFQNTFHYIFNVWLPGSEYELDNREHFEILGDKYKNNDPDSEEEVWIPVKFVKTRNNKD